MNTAGAPRQYKVEDMIEDLKKYLESHEDPIMQEFLLGVPYCKDTLHRYKKESTILSDTIKKLHYKQELRTIRNVEDGSMPVAWAIFKMKQPIYGWTDKQVIEQTIVDTSILDSMLNQLDE